MTWNSHSVMSSLVAVLDNSLTPLTLTAGYSYARPGSDIICNFWLPGTLMFSPVDSELATDALQTYKSQPPALECPDVKNYKWWLISVWNRMLCSCTHMATVGIKGLI